MIFIRTDMNEMIATGHVMRCLAIADAAKQLGEETTFILSDLQAVHLIEARGHSFICMETKWNQMDLELPVLKKIIETEKIETILIDSYQVTSDYMKEVSKLVKVFYIDDLGEQTYHADGIICYAPYWEKFSYHKRYMGKELCLGMEYIPLRKAFCNCARKEIKPEAEHLLLLSGGTDPYGVLSQLLLGIEIEKYKEITVICGRYDGNYEDLYQKYEKLQNVHVYQSVEKIEDYMKRADVAISAGGTTLYELSAVGTPTISYSFADNQMENVRCLAKDEMIDYAGDIRKDDIVKNVRKYLDCYHRDERLRKKKSLQMQQLVDGRGAERIARRLLENYLPFNVGKVKSKKSIK